MPLQADAVRSLIESTGKYRVLSANNEGMNAFAFHAEHRLLGRDVFLKVYDADADADSSELFQEPQLLVEATASGSGAGNLVEVYDAELLLGTYVLLAMEFVEGGSLQELIETGPVPQLEAIHLSVGILTGLSQLHSHSILHRDLKPGNVVLSQSGNARRAKISDFGSAARLIDDTSYVTASRHSALYVPPEGWAEEAHYSKRSDLYQVGLIIYQLLNGPLPTSPDAFLDVEANREIQRHRATGGQLHSADMSLIVDRAIARRAAQGKLTQLVTPQPYVSRKLRSIVQRSVHPEETKRHQTPSELVAALQAVRVANWRCTAPGECTAPDWHGYIWQVTSSSAKVDLGQFVVRRRRQGTNWRRWGGVFPSVEKAVAAVDAV